MGSVPKDWSDEAMAEWIDDMDDRGDRSALSYIPLARAVRALVERAVAEERASTREKVREAVRLAAGFNNWNNDAIVARVLGDHPSNASGGHDEGRPARGEAPRG